MKPYSEDEKRVADYLQELLPEVGTGDDPISFLLASHRTIVDERRDQVARQNEWMKNHNIDSIIPPRCKEDVVDLLFMVQVGNVSCRRGADLLFPQFKN